MKVSVTEKARLSKSTVKTMFLCLSDMKVIIYYEFARRKKETTKPLTSRFESLRKPISLKRPDRWPEKQKYQYRNKHASAKRG
jgi:hypothetical protein